jgi:hypothetical protein
MGIVGTLEDHRGQGLMRALNREFDGTLEQEAFHIAVIQGIPGFYGQFGYSYAVPLENHIDLPFHAIPEGQPEGLYGFRLAGEHDVQFLMHEDGRYREYFGLSVSRSAAHWKYLLGESQKTEYGSEFWIMESPATSEAYYFRVPAMGFGKGLIVSEVSDHVTSRALDCLFAFCKRRAIERSKPYIRLNVHSDSAAGRMALALGARQGRTYAWQVKIPDVIRFLKQISSGLEARMARSCFRRFSGAFRLDFYRSAVDLVWKDGALTTVKPAAGDAGHKLSICTDLFPALCLGHRSWRELRHVRPDIYPSSATAALLVETLFPSLRAWIHEQY